MRTVLHCSSGDRDDWNHALANAENLLDDDTLELAAAAFVANGDAVRMLTEGSPVADRVAALADRGTTFAACSKSLASRDVPTEDLLPDVDEASSGVGELTLRQEDGYAYVKVP